MSAQATVALCKTLLEHDFGLQWEFPADRLCPTVPSRLNYLLWLDDLLAHKRLDGKQPRPEVIGLHGDVVHTHSGGRPRGVGIGSGMPRTGVDVGTGASCIYPLLGAAALGWRFIATELDPRSVRAARHNVVLNKLESQIDVRAVHMPSKADAATEGSTAEADAGAAVVGEAGYDEPEASSVAGEAPLLVGVLRECEGADFVMCNPPFFDARETPRQRQDTVAGSLAAPNEQFTSGGEVGFVKRMIAESVVMGERVCRSSPTGHELHATVRALCKRTGNRGSAGCAIVVGALHYRSCACACHVSLRRCCGSPPSWDESRRYSLYYVRCGMYALRTCERLSWRR